MKINHCGIYSFPKSGNTWMREIIKGLLDTTEHTRKVVPDIYQDGMTGSTFTTPDDSQWRFYKSHSAKELSKHKGQDLNNDLIIYVMRNPLDIFCSQLNFLMNGFSPNRGGIQVRCSSIDEAKETGLLDDFFAAFLVYGTLTPSFLDAAAWMQNVTYWVERATYDSNIVVVKYEDLFADMDSAMAPVLQKLSFEPSTLATAMKKANSRTNDGGKFFWKKQAGTYKSYLTNYHVRRFISLHRDCLQLTGYLDHL